jgi:hypothetical protein
MAALLAVSKGQIPAVQRIGKYPSNSQIEKAA